MCCPLATLQFERQLKSHMDWLSTQLTQNVWKLPNLGDLTQPSRVGICGVHSTLPANNCDAEAGAESTSHKLVAAANRSTQMQYYRLLLLNSSRQLMQEKTRTSRIPAPDTRKVRVTRTINFKLNRSHLKHRSQYEAGKHFLENRSVFLQNRSGCFD